MKHSDTIMPTKNRLLSRHNNETITTLRSSKLKHRVGLICTPVPVPQVLVDTVRETWNMPPNIGSTGSAYMYSRPQSSPAAGSAGSPGGTLGSTTADLLLFLPFYGSRSPLGVGLPHFNSVFLERFHSY